MNRTSVLTVGAVEVGRHCDPISAVAINRAMSTHPSPVLSQKVDAFGKENEQ